MCTKRAIASKLSGIPYTRSVSCAPELDGWTLVVKHDSDDVGKAMEAIIGETSGLERAGTSSSLTHVCSTCPKTHP